MTALVTMLIICWTPVNAELREAWRIEKVVTLEHCITMNRVAAGGGRLGAISVRCGINDHDWGFK